MKTPLKLNFLTGNQNKFEEIKHLIIENNIPIDLKKRKMDLNEIQADNIEEIAIFKVKSIKNQFDESYFVEDAGFFVLDKLGGFPGPYSHYVMDKIGNQGILDLLRDSDQRRACFRAVIALYFKPESKIYTFSGQVDGKVAYSIRGNNGFGFDPIFIPDEAPDKTFGEMTTKEKGLLSHRSKAAHKLIEFLKKRLL